MLCVCPDGAMDRTLIKGQENVAAIDFCTLATTSKLKTPHRDGCVAPLRPGRNGKNWKPNYVQSRVPLSRALIDERLSWEPLGSLLRCQREQRPM